MSHSLLSDERLSSQPRLMSLLILVLCMLAPMKIGLFFGTAGAPTRFNFTFNGSKAFPRFCGLQHLNSMNAVTFVDTVGSRYYQSVNETGHI